REHQLAVFDRPRVRALLLEGVLHLEQIREIGGRVDPDGEIDRLLVVVEELQLLVEAVADGTLADDGRIRVDVNGASSRYEEEVGLEVVEVVSGKRIQPVPVHGENPLGEKAGVEREQPRRIARRCLDVPGPIADDERVAVEDLDDAVRHTADVVSAPAGVAAPAGVVARSGAIGKRRWNRTSSSQSPPISISPRSTAAIALISPVATRSNVSRLARSMQSAPISPATTSM